MIHVKLHANREWLNHVHLEVVLANVGPTVNECLLHHPLVNIATQQQSLLMFKNKSVPIPPHHIDSHLDRVQVMLCHLLSCALLAKSGHYLLLKVLIDGDLGAATIQIDES